MSRPRSMRATRIRITRAAHLVRMSHQWALSMRFVKWFGVVVALGAIDNPTPAQLDRALQFMGRIIPTEGTR